MFWIGTKKKGKVRYTCALCDKQKTNRLCKLAKKFYIKACLLCLQAMISGIARIKVNDLTGNRTVEFNLFHLLETFKILKLYAFSTELHDRSKDSYLFSCIIVSQTIGNVNWVLFPCKINLFIFLQLWNSEQQPAIISQSYRCCFIKASETIF